MKSSKKWNIQASKFAENTINPIRQVLENLSATPNPERSFIPLSIGDPTIFGNMKPHSIVVEAMIESLRSEKFNGYLPSVGCESAREAIAEYSSIEGLKVDPKDVIITSGCSHALEMCIEVLGRPGSNMLIPRPGFPLYQTICGSFDVKIKFYDLRPDRDWQIDLDHLDSIIDDNTVAVVYNNPSNPCGSVYSRQHIADFLAMVERRRVPVIADEIYENLVFEGQKFIPAAAMSQEVPILSVGGLTKRFLVPGYRCGWIIIHDRCDRFGNKIKKGLHNITHRIVGCNSVVQGAIPKILKETPQSFHDETRKLIEKNAGVCHSILKGIPGLRPIMPAGAMYMMVSLKMSYFPEIESDLAFVERLMSEESVFPMPGKVFNVQNYIRIVLTIPTELLIEACKRIEKFCYTHSTVNGKYEGNSDIPLISSNLRESITVD